MPSGDEIILITKRMRVRVRVAVVACNGPGDSKYNPVITFRYSMLFSVMFWYYPYLIHQCQIPTLRERFWRQYSKQYDTDDTNTMLRLELTSMLDSLGSTLNRSTVSSFSPRFDKKARHDDITIDRAIQCLESELGRPKSEMKRLDADDRLPESSGNVTPVLSITDDRG